MTFKDRFVVCGFGGAPQPVFMSLLASFALSYPTDPGDSALLFRSFVVVYLEHLFIFICCIKLYESKIYIAYNSLT